MYKEVYTAKVKKDIKKVRKQGKDKNKLKEVVDKLKSGEPLEEKYRDHSLTGNYINCRECHI